MTTVYKAAVAVRKCIESIRGTEFFKITNIILNRLTPKKKKKKKLTQISGDHFWRRFIVRKALLDIQQAAITYWS